MMIDANAIKLKMAELLRLPADRLDDSAILTDLVTESFVLVEMVIELQEEFGVRIVQDDLKGVKTVGDIVRVFADRAAG